MHHFTLHLPFFFGFLVAHLCIILSCVQGGLPTTETSLEVGVGVHTDVEVHSDAGKKLRLFLNKSFPCFFVFSIAALRWLDPFSFYLTDFKT